MVSCSLDVTLATPSSYFALKLKSSAQRKQPPGASQLYAKESPKPSGLELKTVQET